MRTPFTEAFGVRHPVALGGMAGPTTPELVAAVSNAGGLGILGATGTPRDEFRATVEGIRRLTERPFGLNLLLFLCSDEDVRAAVDAGPPVLSTAWPREDQDLRSLFGYARERGVRVLHMVPAVPDAVRAAAAGADAIVAQGSEGGGHIGEMGTSVIVPMVADAVGPLPVLGAGGVADGRGLAAMLALGADGVLLGTRFLATPEARLHERFKQAIVESSGHDTIATDVTDILAGSDWPGALARVSRNRLVERWLGRANELRRHRAEAIERAGGARRGGDTEEAVLYMGQVAGLIDEVRPAAEIVESIVREAEEIVGQRLPSLLG